MKSIHLVIMLSITGLFAGSCQKGSMWGIKGEGETVTESRQVSQFTALDLSIAADISYIQDSIYRLELSGQNNILSVLDTRVEGGSLKFEFKRNIWHHNRLSIIVHSPLINRMMISGDGNIFVENEIKGHNLDLTIGGSGNITVGSLSLQSLSADIKGSGNVTFNGGVTANAYFKISGDGTIYSEQLNSDYANANISGSGSMVLNVSQRLDIMITGSGDVSYKGNPIVSSNITGDGRVVHLN